MKLTLQEQFKPAHWSLAHRAFQAFELALGDYVMLGLGFFGIMLASWIGVMVVRELRRMMLKSAGV